MPRHAQRADIRLTDGDFYASQPFEQYAWMRANAPVYFDGQVWGITRHDDVQTVSKDSQTFCNKHGMRPDSPPVPSMINMDDPEHKLRRGLVNKGFTPRRVKESEAAVRKACDDIIDAVCEKGECDFVNDIAAWLPMIMIGDALGVDPGDRKQLLEWSDGMMKALTGDPNSVEKATEAFIGYQAFATEAIAARRCEPTDDLMSVLVHAEVDGDRLTDDELIHESLLILIGGDETTRHVISGGMYQLLVNPDQKRKLVEDRSKIPIAVEEMLRWVSPIKNMARTITRETELRGQTLHEGEKLLLLYPSANRDEDVFPDPFRFDVERRPNEHVAFGFGTHFCLGNSLARLELVCMFEHVLKRLPDIEIVDGSEPGYRPANFISGYEEMRVRFTPTEPLLS